MGYSESLWTCPVCGSEATTNYSNIADVGTPDCNDCGCDMIFVSEKWVRGGKK